MAGKKEQSVVTVIDGLTSIQAANIQADILKSKSKNAPNSRGISTIGNRQDVGKMLTSSNDTIKKIESEEAKINGKKK
jgi:hypothetical protein